MQRGVTVRGRVQSADGTPIASARIEWTGADDQELRQFLGLHGKLGRRTTSGSDGRFTMTGLPRGGRVLVHATESGRGSSGRTWLDVGKESGGDLLIVVAGAASLQGRLLSPEGEAVAGAEIIHVPAPDGVAVRGLAATAGAVIARSDAGGRFLLADVPAGPGHLELRAPEEFAFADADTSIVLQAGGTGERVFSLQRTLGITGQVLDDAGKPVAGCDLTFVRYGARTPGDPTVFREVFTGSDGRFAVWRLAPDDYAVRASQLDLLVRAKQPRDRVLVAVGRQVRAGSRPIELVMRWSTLAALRTNGTRAGCEHGCDHEHGTSAPATTGGR